MAIDAQVVDRLNSAKLKVLRDDADNSVILKVVLVDDAGEATVLSGDVTNLENITITASALPAGASTSAKQDTANTSLAAINTAIGAKTDAAWDGVAASASVISLLKAIALNTTPA